LGVGIVGFWHVHAGDYASDARRHARTRIVAGWDADAELARTGTSALGIRSDASLDALLSSPDVDAVIVTTATADHVDVIGRAIAAGKHVFAEKLLAPTVADAEHLVASAREAGIALVVSLPRFAEPAVLAARGLIDDGALGRVTYARVRMAHDGWVGGWLPERFSDPAAAVGGAFADLGCHPAYLIQHFLGTRPETVSAGYTRVTGHRVDDNAVVTARYSDGAIGVAEASFVTTPGAFAFEVRGTEASVMYGLGREALIGKGGRLGDAWAEIALPAPATGPFDAWVDAIDHGTDTATNTTAAIELTRFVAAAERSARSGAEEILEE
jgi:predicted dehydrogenase